MTRGIILNDMPPTRNYNFGKGNVLITDAASGILRDGEGITSTLVTGKAAGESILRSIECGKIPIECYLEHELLRSERDRCEKVYERFAELRKGITS